MTNINRMTAITTTIAAIRARAEYVEEEAYSAFYQWEVANLNAMADQLQELIDSGKKLPSRRAIVAVLERGYADEHEGMCLSEDKREFWRQAAKLGEELKVAFRDLPWFPQVGSRRNRAA